MLKLKICGLRHPENINAIAKLPIHYMGFIFYPKSPRYVGEELNSAVLQSIPTGIKKVGVFVNEEAEALLAAQNKYGLDLLQLHGGECPELCRDLKMAGAFIIKAFQMDEDFDFAVLENYEDVVDYFLFDTRSKQYGGSGHKFNWRILEKYLGKKPFFLSGGIGPDDAKAIQELQHPQLFALDVNSGFEDYPGYKNISNLIQFLKDLTTKSTKINSKNTK